MIAAIDLPTIKVGEGFDNIVEWLVNNMSGFFEGIGSFLETITNDLADLLGAPPAELMAVILAVLAVLARGWLFGLFSLIAMLFIQSMPTIDLWEHSMLTLALVIVASAIAMILALPIGILAARSRIVASVVRPVLDFMQTLPPFVYLLPAIFLFGLGIPPGAVATIVFAMPPGVRLTELGIRQVDPELVEAGHAFGSPQSRVLTRIQLPLAMPTIMAGMNQVIMLSLSMVVIAGMVGAAGLGQDVYQGITSLDLVLGFESGISVVILAIYLDRLTSGLAQGGGPRLKIRSKAAA